MQDDSTPAAGRQRVRMLVVLMEGNDDEDEGDGSDNMKSLRT